MKQCWMQPAERMPPQPVNPPLPFHITATNYSKHLTMLTENIEQMKQCWLLPAKMMTMPYPHVNNTPESQPLANFSPNAAT